MRLYNRADLVDGHYCIARSMPEAPQYAQFWHESASGDGWSGFGTVYVGKDAAAAKLYQLCGMPSRVRKSATSPGRASR